jgi:hypothetical protein
LNRSVNQGEEVGGGEDSILSPNLASPLKGRELKERRQDLTRGTLRIDQ